MGMSVRQVRWLSNMPATNAGQGGSLVLDPYLLALFVALVLLLLLLAAAAAMLAYGESSSADDQRRFASCGEDQRRIHTCQVGVGVCLKVSSVRA